MTIWTNPGGVSAEVRAKSAALPQHGFRVGYYAINAFELDPSSGTVSR